MTHPRNERRIRHLVLLLPLGFALLAWQLLGDRGVDPGSVGSLTTAGMEHVLREHDVEGRTEIGHAPRSPRLGGGGRTAEATGPRDVRRIRHSSMPGDIRGHVLDPDGIPVGDATVTVHRQPGGVGRTVHEMEPLLTARSDSRGAFRLASVPPGRFLVRAEAEGHAPTARPGIGPGTVLTLRLHPSGHLRVCVLDAEGRPFMGAAASYVGVATARPTRTGRDGVVQLRDLPCGRGQILVHDGRGRLARQAVEILAGETTDVACILPDGVTLRGEVWERGTDRPVEGARVRIAFAGQPDLEPDAVRSDASGRFELGPVVLEEGRPRVVAEKEGYATAQRGLALLGLPDAEPCLRLELWPEAVVRGRVLDPAGGPAAGAQVRWIQEAASEAKAMGQTTADHRGRFELPLPIGPSEHGSFGLVAEGRDGTYGAASVRGSELGNEDVVVNLRGTGSLSGTVRDNQGHARAGALVILVPDSQGMLRSTTSAAEGLARVRGLTSDTRDRIHLQSATDTAGAFHIAGLPAGDYRLRVEHGEDSVWLSRGATVGPDEQGRIDIILPSSTVIAGWVVGPDGERIAGAAVTARPADDGAGVVGGDTANSGADGRFELTRVRGDGGWDLTAIAPGYAVGRVASVWSGTHGVEIHLERGHLLRGTVMRAGHPYGRDFVVRLTRGRAADTRTGGGSHAVPIRPRAAGEKACRGTEGAFVLEGVRPADYVVVAESLDGRLRSQPMEVRVEAGRSVEPLTLDLLASSRLAGSVRRARSGECVAQALVSLHPWVDHVLQDPPLATAVADSSGRYELAGLPPGRYRLQAMGPGAMPFAEDLELRAGDEARRDLVLRDL